jgi:hypothetical protein
MGRISSDLDDATPGHLDRQPTAGGADPTERQPFAVHLLIAHASPHGAIVSALTKPVGRWMPTSMLSCIPQPTSPVASSNRHKLSLRMAYRRRTVRIGEVVHETFDFDRALVDAVPPGGIGYRIRAGSQVQGA